MLKNTFLTAIRSFLKNKTVSLINVTGLGVGLATCILLLLYIWDEGSFDRHHKHGKEVYRIGINFGDFTAASSPAPMAEGFKSNFPEVLQSTRLFKYPMLESMVLKSEIDGELKIFQEPFGYYVDSTFFDVFSYSFIVGDPEKALQEPNTIVLSKTLADKLFVGEFTLDQTITLGLPEGEFDYRVVGVFDDKGLKSHINANFLLSMQNTDIGSYVEQENSWKNNNMFHTYIRVSPGVESHTVESKLNGFYQQKMGEDIQALGFSSNLFLQPLENIYLTSDLGFEVGPTGSRTLLYVFGSIGIFILLIACINFMNLSTAKSGLRAKEVGVRKVVGADKKQLVFQFLMESLVISLFSLLIALILVLILLPVFNQITDKALQYADNWNVMIFALGLTIVTGIIAGLYPAFYLSGFKPLQILKGVTLSSQSTVSIRKGLVVFQFVISVTLIGLVLVVQKQMSFMQHSSLGFDKDQQLVLPLQSNEAMENFSVLKNQLQNQQGVSMVSGGSVYPGIEVLQDWLLYEEGKTEDDVVDVIIGRASEDYLETLGMELIQGRSFTAAYPEMGNYLIINQSAAKAFDLEEEDAIGKILIMEWQGQKNEFEIVGLVKDFHFQSLHQTIKPFAWIPTQKPNYLVAKFETNQTATLLASIERIWRNINPSTPFSYTFLDQDFKRNYEKEQKTATVIFYFTGVAILISCIGLFGLAAFTAEQKTKEIGIRKVLGASTYNITALVSREFVVLVTISVLIAAPIAFFASGKWLENFAYKIDLGWNIFLLSGIIAVCVAYATVSFQAIKAALTNPVDTLRSQ
ncbi:ABC transporter permease [Arthrospiribacter ruber]|uniref:FtsX-like permease family protein n=1 Tax=Arthrospiribacter ruber TaxID=2487934 RepID=A0A951IZF6_9BACT|nr:ABC transporter permease [Arthrospiribacter ruber]MBW3468662.1 FtsX-like permease family protein [Arthrospiribacter ruber]